MKQLYSRYSWLLILVLLLLWSIFTPCYFQKGGIPQVYHYTITLFIIGISVLINLRFYQFSLIKRLLFAVLSALVALLIITSYVVSDFVYLFYHGRTWDLWEPEEKQFVNAIYYGMLGITLTRMAKTYFKPQKQ